MIDVRGRAILEIVVLQIESLKEETGDDEVELLLEIIGCLGLWGRYLLDLYQRMSEERYHLLKKLIPSAIESLGHEIAGLSSIHE